MKRGLIAAAALLLWLASMAEVLGREPAGPPVIRLDAIIAAAE